MTWVYFANRPGDLAHVKIGITDNLDRRMRQLRCSVLLALPFEDRVEAIEAEQGIHEAFAELRLPGSEWFVMPVWLHKAIILNFAPGAVTSGLWTVEEVVF